MAYSAAKPPTTNFDFFSDFGHNYVILSLAHIKKNEIMSGDIILIR